MDKFLLFAIAYLFAIGYVYAQLPQYQGEYNQNQTLREYFAAEDENYNKSIIYVFYNNQFKLGKNRLQ